MQSLMIYQVVKGRHCQIQNERQMSWSPIAWSDDIDTRLREDKFKVQTEEQDELRGDKGDQSFLYLARLETTEGTIPKFFTS